MVANTKCWNAGYLCRVWTTAPRVGWAIRQFVDLLCNSGFWLYRDRARIAAESNTACRPSDLYSLGAAFHTTGDGWNRKRAQQASADVARVRHCCRDWR